MQARRDSRLYNLHVTTHYCQLELDRNWVVTLHALSAVVVSDRMAPPPSTRIVIR